MLSIKIDFEIGSKPTLVIPVDSPVLVIAETDSNNASMKLLLVRYFIEIPEIKDNTINKAITSNASLNIFSDKRILTLLRRPSFVFKKCFFCFKCES